MTSKIAKCAIGAMVASIAATQLDAQQIRVSEEYKDFYAGDTTKGINFVQSIKVSEPEYCSDVKGEVTVKFTAPGMKHVKAFCWQQPTQSKPGKWGHDAQIADIKLGADGAGSFVFHADQFPNGPVTIRIQAKDDKDKQDYCELQLFNLGGVAWNQGIPKYDPPGAKGMKLVFADDFDGPLSISPSGINARYAAHKTGGGDFSGWAFSDPAGEDKPFGQRGSFLRIHASKPRGSNGRSGILSSLRSDGTGVCVPVPSYFECRFVAHCAPGSWPAFWTLTKGTIGMSGHDPDFEAVKKMGTDELDIIEAYGGYGPRNPNSGGLYHSVSHFWGQDKPAWNEKKLPNGSENKNFKPSNFLTDTLKLGGKSSWSWTFHTYGCAITETDTIYYFDDIEIGRHPTGATSLASPAWFLINYSIGGISGWQIDMERYNNKTDMWVDFVRVYCGAALAPAIAVDGFVGAKPAVVRMSSETRGAEIRYTTDGSEPTAASPRYNAPVSISKPCTLKAAAFASGLKQSPSAKAVISAPPGIAGSIGVNFFESDVAAQRLEANEIVGVGAEAQANWNAVAAGAAAKAGELVTSDGAAAKGVAMMVAGQAGGFKCESWGFSSSDLKLQTGSLSPNPEVTFTGIPYAKYDVLVFLSAGVNSSSGNVSIGKPGNAKGEVDAIGAYYFNLGWLSGKFGRATTTEAGQKPADANYVRFAGNTADAFTISLKSTSHWTGLSAIQIIPAK